MPVPASAWRGGVLDRRHDPAVWTPVRHVKAPQVCQFCWETIPRGSPGTSTGTRGTKAFYNAALREWECMKCREEATRADLARQAELEARTHKESPMKRAALAVLLLLAAVQAYAAAGITAIAVQPRQRNLTSVAIKAVVQGDDDSTAVLRIFQRWQGAPSYDTGMVMVRRFGFGPTTGNVTTDNQNAGNVYEGRILNMTPGRVVEYYIEGIDGGGNLNAFSAGSPDTVSCARVRPMVATGPVYYVDQANGDDNNAGTKARPKKTINAALTALGQSANEGQNGGVIVAPGEYHERIDLDSSRFPTDGYMHFLSGDGTNPDSTIICGANPWGELGLYAPGKPLRWVFTGQDSTWRTYFPASTAGSSPGDSMQLVVIGYSEYIHRKTSIRAVLDDSTYAYTSASPGHPGAVGDGELSGWYWQNDTLYVKRRNGRSPAGNTLHLGYLDNLIGVKRRNWRISRLTLRYAGGVENTLGAYRASVDPGLNGYGISAGFSGSGAGFGSGLVVDSCKIIGVNADAIKIVNGVGGQRADSVVIANTTIDGLTLGGMNYGAGKSRAEEDMCQIQMNTRGSSVVNCTITGTFNGIQLVGSEPDTLGGYGCELSGNAITNLVDDAIEIDAGNAINTLVYGNTTRNTGRAISQAPIYSGPVFAFFNTFTNFKTMGVKAGGGSRGKVLYQHNTFASSVNGSSAMDMSSGGSVDGITAENNILAGSGTYSGIRGPASGGSILKNQFNWNVYEPVQTTQLTSWNGLNYTLGLMQSSLTWEKNGLQATGAFVDSTRANYSLKAGSPALGVARRITGVNTGLDGIRYQTNPDAGAEERITP